MSFFKSIGKVLKKVAPIAGLVAPFIPGVGGLIGKAIGGISSAMGATSSLSSSEPYGPGIGDGASIPGVGSTGDAFSPFTALGSAFGAMPWGALAGGAATYFGGQQQNEANAQQAQLNRDFQAQWAQKQMDFQAAQNQKQMDFQTEMSNTQYQRATKDMESAGLNPMLGYSQGGAGNVGGSTSSGAGVSGAQAQASNALGQGVSSAMQAMTTLETVQNLMAQNEQIHAQTENTDADTAVMRDRILNMEEERLSMRVQRGLATAQEKEAYERMTNLRAVRGSLQAQSSVDQASIEADKKRRAAESQGATEDTTGQQYRNKLMYEQIPGAEAEARMYERFGGDFVPYGSSAKQFSDIMERIITRGRGIRRPKSSTMNPEDFVR